MTKSTATLVPLRCVDERERDGARDDCQSKAAVRLVAIATKARHGTRLLPRSPRLRRRAPTLDAPPACEAGCVEPTALTFGSRPEAPRKVPNRQYDDQRDDGRRTVSQVNLIEGKRLSSLCGATRPQREEQGVREERAWPYSCMRVGAWPGPQSVRVVNVDDRLSLAQCKGRRGEGKEHAGEHEKGPAGHPDDRRDGHRPRAFLRSEICPAWYMSCCTEPCSRT